jgi:hypothetical protein
MMLKGFSALTVLVGLLQLITASDRLAPMANSYNKLQPNL